MERTIATIFTGYGQTKVPIFGICCILILVGNFINYRRCWVIIVCNYCFNFN
uniref:Candidate secreted effector n=1 Tax=Meloidogyne incognita TaxID=6306 RepID=A0A914NAM2_MELIC